MIAYMHFLQGQFTEKTKEPKLTVAKPLTEATELDGGRAGAKTQVFGSQSAIKEDKEPILYGRLKWKEQLSGC